MSKTENNSKVQVKKVHIHIPKFLKNPYFIFGASVVLFALAFFCMILMDSENVVKPSWMFVSFFRDLFAAFGLKPFNVRITTWFMFFLIFGTFFVVFFILLTYKKMVASKNMKSVERYDHELSKKDLRKFNILYFTCCGVAYGAGLALVLALWPYHWNNWTGVADNFLNLLEALGILLIFLLSVPLALFIVYWVFKFLIWIISLIVSGVSSSVMSSEKYQKNKAISEAAANDISRILTNSKNAADQVFENQCFVANGNEPKVKYIFPALHAIDVKYNPSLEEVEKPIEENTELSVENKEKEVKPEISENNEQVVEEVSNVEGAPKRVEKAYTYQEIKDLSYKFQSYLCHRDLFFNIDLIRTFIAGLAASRLVLLQGVSGTGKSTLPRVFMEFISGKAHFFPVQATWKDRSDITGYFDIFSGTYKETELLKTLYEASYTTNETNIMVLDEMNISRVEYYFADFLSIFEYPSSDWLIPLIHAEEGLNLPELMEEGSVRIPLNTWFIGTINIDESTFGVSDKVYDRAIVINFKEINKPFKTDYPYEPIEMSVKELAYIFNKCKQTEAYRMTEKEKSSLNDLCTFACQALDINYGNRILNQIYNFVPVFVGLGGSKTKAMDIMFANKILRKVAGRYDTYIRDGLVKLSRYIQTTFEEGQFKDSLALINRYVRRLS